MLLQRLKHMEELLMNLRYELDHVLPLMLLILLQLRLLRL
jgi:hypothetical protein